jgi:hypothetical protein
MKYGDTVPILMPLYKDTIDLGILEYFKTRNFERLCVKLGISGSQGVIRLMNNPNPDDYGKYLSHFFSGYSNPYFTAIADMLIGFLENSSELLDFKDIIVDIKVANFPQKDIDRVVNSYYNEHKPRFINENINNVNDQNITKTKQLESNFLNIISIKDSSIQKKNWIKDISKAEIEKVVDEIIEYGVDNNHDIIALSSRWHSLKDKYNKGVMKEDDFGIENNKIVHALLDFIKNMKNTEGV